MGDEVIEVGDRVVNLQVPGVFRVLSREGRVIVIESAGGMRLRLSREGVRRVSGTAVVPKDA